MLLKEIKDQNKWKDVPSSQTRGLGITTTTMRLKLIHGFRTMLSESQVDCCIYRQADPQIPEGIEEAQNTQSHS